MRKLHLFILGAVLVGLTACNKGLVYSRFQPVSSDNALSSIGGWHVDSVPSFDYTIEDAAAEYRMLVYVRHTERYPYQNMWLFVDEGTHRDTIEFYLADDRGRWLGDKHHGFIEMPVLYEANYHYPDTGRYYIAIQHGMRDRVLRGITDVGVEIVKNEGENERMRSGEE